MRYLITLLVGLTLAGLASAACSGSGTTWSCPAGATNSDVAAAISAGTSGMTITQATGSATWTGTVSMPTTKGFTYICATVGGCTITTSSMPFGMGGMPSGTFSTLIRVSGFVWNSSNRLMWICSSGGCHDSTITSLRIDNNTFNGSGSQFFLFGDNSSTNIFVYGVMDHNNITLAGSGVIFEFISTLNSTSPATANPLGQSTNMFLENNTISVTTPTNSGVGCTDGWGGAFSVVARYNTTTNCRWLTHGTGDGGGPRNFEAYNNSTTWTSNNGGLGSGSTGIQNCYRAYHNQGGGTGMAFNNSCIPFGTVSGDAIVVQNFRSACPNSGGEGNGQACCDGTQSGATYGGTTYTSVTDGNRAGEHGYPCWHQMSRDDALVLHTVGMWNNTTTGGVLLGGGFDDLGGSPDNSSYQMVNGRDYVKGGAQQTTSTSPFNGSSGMGWGTLARRPANCTKSTDTGDVGGTAYFATDSGPQGTLFACAISGTPGTWTAIYSPYTHPHPLVSGGGAPIVSLSPSSLTFTTNQLTTSAPQTVTLTNTGTASLTVSSVSISGSFTNSGGTCGAAPFTVGVSASCTFIITFSPASTGSFSGTLSLSDNAAGSPHTVPLSGTGTAPVATWTPSSYAFGSILIGVPTDSSLLTLQNTGNGPLSVNLTFTGANPTLFTQSATTCSSTLAVSASCTVTVRFTPTAASSYSANLTETDSGQSITQNLALTGTGVTPTPVTAPAPWLLLQ